MRTHPSLPYSDLRGWRWRRVTEGTFLPLLWKRYRYETLAARGAEKTAGGFEAMIRPRKTWEGESIGESEGDDMGDIVDLSPRMTTKDGQGGRDETRGIQDKSIKSNEQVFFQLTK